MTILAGYGEKNISLRKGMKMIGYGARNEVAQGIHDPLKVKSYFFTDGITKFIMISCDLMGLSADFIQNINKKISKIIEIKEQNIIIAATHTHSGPASMSVANSGVLIEQWLGNLEETILACALAAYNDKRDCKINYITGSSYIGYNRVLASEIGKKKAINEIDEQIGILEIKNSKDNQLYSILINYACHPVVLGSNNYLYSADYPYYLVNTLKKQLSSKVNISFFNGCCGDIDPLQRGTFAEAEKLGSKLADDVIDSLTKKEHYSLEAKISVNSFKLKIPFEFDYDIADLEIIETKLINEIDSQINNKDLKVIRELKYKLTWVQKLLKKAHQNQGIPAGVEAEFKRIQVGKLDIITLPFEVLHDIGLKIKKLFGKDSTMVIGYSNGLYGYLPSERLYDIANYEAGTSCRYYLNPGPVTKKAEQMILSALAKEFLQ